MKAGKKHEIRKSSPVNDIIGDPPSAMVRWGISIIAVIFILALGASWMINYPYIVSAELELTTSNPPASIMAHTSGRIVELFVSQGQDVNKGDYLGLLETSADIESIFWLNEYLDNKSDRDGDRDYLDPVDPLPGDEPLLGELQSVYSDFLKTYRDYVNHVQVDYYGRKIDALLNEINGIELYISQLGDKERLISGKLRLAESEFDRDSLLYAEGVISLQDYENARESFYNEQIELEQVRLERSSKIIDRSSRMQDLEDYRARRVEERELAKTLLINKRSVLRGELDQWFLKHLLVSPIKGKVTFSDYWGENQSVKEGEVVMNVIPDGESKIIGRAMIPMRGSGKVSQGQKTLMKISGYPYLEYGMVEGVIESISLTAINGHYIAEIGLPGGLVTNYGKQLEFNQRMMGTAEIITDDTRLIESIVDPFRYLIKRNKMLEKD